MTFSTRIMPIPSRSSTKRIPRWDSRRYVHGSSPEAGHHSNKQPSVLDVSPIHVFATSMSWRLALAQPMSSAICAAKNSFSVSSHRQPQQRLNRDLVMTANHTHHRPRSQQILWFVFPAMCLASEGMSRFKVYGRSYSTASIPCFHLRPHNSFPRTCHILDCAC